jgi:hypothetical protein
MSGEARVISNDLGRALADDAKCVTFCPRYPENVMQHHSSLEDILKKSQRDFWALDLDQSERQDSLANLREVRVGFDVADSDGVFQDLASPSSSKGEVPYEGPSWPGIPTVTFSTILKRDSFPLASILTQLMKIGEDGFGCPVRMEFAVKLPHALHETAELGVLQMCGGSRKRGGLALVNAPHSRAAV